jgi:CRISPR-associated exonuclease Cas4
MNALLAPAVAAVGAVVVLVAAWQLARRSRERSIGELWVIDDGVSGGAPLASTRYRLRGRPDAIRRSHDGALVPVEVKHRNAPPGGPFPSHRIQLGAYALLLEEASGRPPAFGILRYRDRDVRVAWDDRARSEVLAVRAAVDRPYDGRATPSVARCRGCRWAPVCDRSAVRAAPAP